MFRINSNYNFIIRYHDAIPLFMSDTMPSHNTTKLHYFPTKNCESAIFVCNSPNSSDEPNTIFSEISRKRSYYPVFLTDNIGKVMRILNVFQDPLFYQLWEDLFDELSCKDKR